MTANNFPRYAYALRLEVDRNQIGINDYPLEYEANQIGTIILV